MGMWTEIHLNAALREDTPEDVMKLLRHMVGGPDIPTPPTPDHPLFATRRWSTMLCSESAYFDYESHSAVTHNYDGSGYLLAVKSNLKNYDNEIEKFIDWLMPYLDKSEGDFLGFYRYEEDDQPTLIHYRKMGESP